MSIAIDAKNLHIYHQSESLLFQFILSEFIDSHKELTNIDNILLILKKNFNKSILASLKTSVIKLAGSSENPIKLFSWNAQDGILTRLKNYCSHLSSTQKKQKEAVIKMQSDVNQAFLSCLESLDTIRMVEELDESDKKIESLSRLLHKIICKMRHFSKLTTELIHEFHQDENVIFFLLDHQSDLNKLYGSNFLQKMMQKMFPKGLEEAAHFLLRRYKKRGFDHLLPRIKHKIAELKK